MSNRKIAPQITCHAFSPDGKKIALCPNTNEVLIYANADKEDVSEWKLEHTLKGHDLVVSAIDWSPVHNKILTCSHDRNAFVWTLKDGEWKPSLSILRINRAATCCKWSPDGKKFAVASGANVVPVCFYEEANDWWISKMVKRHKSTVLWVAWHPNSQLLATASSDFRCRIFNVMIDKVDAKEGVQAIICGNTSVPSFGDVLAEYDGSNGWVEGCAWSPDGFTLAYVGHDGSITFNSWDPKKPTAGESVNVTIKENFLPSIVVMFLSDTVCVSAGHDMKPHFYQKEGNGWHYVGSPDKEPSAKAGSAGGAEKVDARAMWTNKDVKGQAAGTSAADGSAVWTKHVNSITDIKPYGETQFVTKIDAFSTSGLDGQVYIWKSADFKANLPNLKF